MTLRMSLAGLVAAVALGAPSARAIDIFPGAGYVDNGVVVGGQYGAGLYQGTPRRYIAPGYQGSGLRPYLERYHNRYNRVPPVVLDRPDIPVNRVPAPALRYRTLNGTPALSGAHVDWCSATYRSYRTSDNTFQPYEGPRRECVSPFS